jgi:molecular chaperone DnaJ
MGQVRQGNGFFSITQTCPKCRGTGSIIEKPCSTCRGTGLLEKNKSVTIKINPGTDDGKRIVIRGQGDAGTNGGPSGDLVVFIHVERHPYFERDGNDLVCLVPISITQAALGADISINSLDGKKIAIKIAPGTENGKLLRVKGEGVPIAGTSKKGDLYVKILVQVPQRLSSKQKELLQLFKELENPPEEPKLVSWSQYQN